MAVTLAQVAVETRLCSDSGAMAQVEVVTAPGDLLLILEAVGRVVAWQSAWQIDAGTALAPLASYDEGGEGHLRVYAVTGLAPGTHTIDATNPATGGAARYITHAILVASGADTAALDATDVHADISGGTGATKTWATGAVLGGGAAIGLQASRRGAAVASVSPTSLGTSYVDGVTQSYASGALQALTPVSDSAGETMSVTFGGSGAGAYVALTLAPSAGGEHKTASAAIALDLDTTGHSTKAARSGAALALDLDTSSDPAKTAVAATLLEAALTLQAAGAKHARAATSLAMLLGLDTATTKRAAAATGIDLALTLAATTDLAPEHKTAAATLGLTLALDALAGKHAATGTTVTLALDTTGDATKTGAAVVGLHLVLDAIATAAKTATAEAALSLALAIAAAIVTDTTTPESRTLHIAADDRVITITADDRTLTIDRQDRTITIGAA